MLKDYETVIARDTLNQIYELPNVSLDYIGYFIAQEKNFELCGIRRYLKPDDNWLEGLIKNVPSTYKEGVAQKVSKFANIYMIKVYEKLFNKNILLLKTYSSEISYKIMETSLIQNIAEG
jgi:hypothetical protein